MISRRSFFTQLASAFLLAVPLAAQAQPVKTIPRDREDFLWFMSSEFFLTQPQLLPRHRRQVVLLVVRDVALPHDEDDLQPLRAQGAERLAIRVTARALLVVVRSRPLTPAQREERHVVDDGAQRLVAGKAEPDDLLLAAPYRHGHRSGLRLQMPKRLPPSGRVPQAGPEPGRPDAVVTDRQRPNPLRRRA